MFRVAVAIRISSRIPTCLWLLDTRPHVYAKPYLSSHRLFQSDNDTTQNSLSSGWTEVGSGIP